MSSHSQVRELYSIYVAGRHPWKHFAVLCLFKPLSLQLEQNPCECEEHERNAHNGTDVNDPSQVDPASRAHCGNSIQADTSQTFAERLEDSRLGDLDNVPNGS